MQTVGRWSITVIRSTPTQVTLLLVGPMVKVFSASGSCPHPVCLCKAADRRVVGTVTGIKTPYCEGLEMRGAPWALWAKPQLDFLTGALVVPGMLQHGVNLGPSQKARTQRLILDTLGQPQDDGRCLPKCRARLHRIAGCLIHPAQRRLNLPAFARQPQVCCQPCCLEQVADSLLAPPLPRGKQSLRPQIGEAEAPIGSHTFPQSLHLCSRLAFIPPSQQGLRFILTR